MLAHDTAYHIESSELFHGSYLSIVNNLQALDIYERSILRHLGALLSSEGPLLEQAVSCSFRMLAEAIGMSFATARKKVQGLIEKGFLLGEKVFFEGYTGRMLRGPDRYRLTEKVLSPSAADLEKKSVAQRKGLAVVPHSKEETLAAEKPTRSEAPADLAPQDLSQPLNEPAPTEQETAPAPAPIAKEESPIKTDPPRASAPKKWNNPFHTSIDVSQYDEPIPVDRAEIVRRVHEKLAMGLSERDKGRMATILLMAERSEFDMVLGYYKKYALGVKPLEESPK